MTLENAHSIGFSGGHLSSYGEGSSALDFPLIHDARSGIVSGEGLLTGIEVDNLVRMERVSL
jgi:hypothetical protein